MSTKHGPRPKSFDDRYMPVPESGCWLWLGGTSDRGYGMLMINRKHLLAHRYSFEQARGPIPSGMCVCHKCDTPRCVNPAHLFLGTIGDNNRDTVQKKRHFAQQKTHCAQGHELTPENTQLWRGHRRCRICRTAWSLKVEQRKTKLRREAKNREH